MRSSILGLCDDLRPTIFSATRFDVLTRLKLEHDNLRAALEWARAGDAGPDIGLRLAVAMGDYWVLGYHWREGRRWLEIMLERAGTSPTPIRAAALRLAGHLACLQGDNEIGRLRLEQSVAAWRAIGDRDGLGKTLNTLGRVLGSINDLRAARQMCDASIELLRPRGSLPLAIALNERGIVALNEEDLPEATSCFLESAAIARDIPDPWALAIPLRYLAMVAIHEGDFAKAREYCRDSLALVRSLEERWLFTDALEIMAVINHHGRDLASAVRLLGAAEALREAINAARVQPRRDEYKICARELRVSLGARAFDRLWNEGRSLSRDAAIALAVGLNKAPRERSTRRRLRRDRGLKVAHR